MVDRQLSARFLQEAKVELVCVRRLLRECDGLRSVPPRAVFHCQQAVEMGLNSAMLRTCGVSEDEVAGGAAHDLIDFVKRIRTAETNTAEQRRAQQVPLNEEDVDWLKRSYLASRYPKPGRWGVPSLLYDDADAHRALKLAERFVEWAERVEDLPDPGKTRRRWNQFEESQTVTPAPGETAPPQIPRFIPPPLLKNVTPATAMASGIKRPEPSVDVDRASKAAKPADDEAARKRSADEAAALIGAASKRSRTDGSSEAATGMAAMAGDAAASGSSGKRWARRLRTG